MDEFDACGQTISFLGMGAHHQNGNAEHAIQMITSWAWTMMLHAFLMWPKCTNLHLWTFAMQHAVYLWSHLPAHHGPCLSPIELFTQTHFSSYSFLACLHVWGGPVYVLDPKLQDGKKITKWDPCACCGQVLGISSKHSTPIGLILNLRTGYISTQYHVVFDDLFTSVPNSNHGGLFNANCFDADKWSKLVQAGLEHSVDPDDPDPPPLSDEGPSSPPRFQVFGGGGGGGGG